MKITELSEGGGGRRNASAHSTARNVRGREFRFPARLSISAKGRFTLREFQEGRGVVTPYHTIKFADYLFTTIIGYSYQRAETV